MPQRLTAFARPFLIDEAAFRAQHRAPVLVWEGPEDPIESDLLLTTQGGAPEQRPAMRDPMIFELKPPAGLKQRSLVLGRGKEVDLVVPARLVSREHASFDLATGGAWTLADLESRNGTFLEDRRLEPAVPARLSDGAKVKFGDVEMTFLSPESFVDYIRKRVAEKI